MTKKQKIVAVTWIALVSVAFVLIYRQFSMRGSVEVNTPAQPTLPEMTPTPAMSNSDKEEPSQSNQPDTYNSELFVYTNKELGISFKYPKKWGEAREYRTYQDGDSCLISGKQVSLYFKDIYEEALRRIGQSGGVDIGKSPIYFVFTSPDFSHCSYDYPEGYKGGIQEIEGACKEKESYFYAYDYDCQPISGLSVPSVEYYRATRFPGDYDYFFEKRAKIVSPNPILKGILIKYKTGLSYASPEGVVSPSIDTKTYTLETYEKIKNHKVDKNILEMLDGFDKMLESITFLH